MCFSLSFSSPSLQLSIYLENTNEFAPGNAKVQAITKQMRTVDTILAERGNNVTYTMLKAREAPGTGGCRQPAAGGRWLVAAVWLDAA